MPRRWKAWLFTFDDPRAANTFAKAIEDSGCFHVRTYITRYQRHNVIVEPRCRPGIRNIIIEFAGTFGGAYVGPSIIPDDT